MLWPFIRGYPESPLGDCCCREKRKEKNMNISTRYTGIELVPKYNFSLGYAPVTLTALPDVKSWQVPKA